MWPQNPLPLCFFSLQSCGKSIDSSSSLDTWLKSWDHEIRSRTAQRGHWLRIPIPKQLLKCFLNLWILLAAQWSSFTEQHIKVHEEWMKVLLLPDEGHSGASIHRRWFEYILLNYLCNSGFFNCFASIVLWELLSQKKKKKWLQTKEHLRKTHLRQETETVTLSLFFFSLRIKPNWGEKRNVIMEDNINLVMGSCVKNCLAFSSSAKETVDVYARPRPFLQPFNSPRRLWSGSVVCISLFNNIGNNIFLCSVCCNLGDIFNVVRCFLICMLACSDGLQHCSSMPRWHQKMSFLYSGIQCLSSHLKCNRTVTNPPMLYIASGFIVQGYSPHKCIKCAYCIHSKGTKQSPAFTWS